MAVLASFSLGIVGCSQDTPKSSAAMRRGSPVQAKTTPTTNNQSNAMATSAQNAATEDESTAVPSAASESASTSPTPTPTPASTTDESFVTVDSAKPKEANKYEVVQQEKPKKEGAETPLSEKGVVNADNNKTDAVNIISGPAEFPQISGLTYGRVEESENAELVDMVANQVSQNPLAKTAFPGIEKFTEKYVIKGESQGLIPKECEPAVVEKEQLTSALSTKDYVVRIKKWLETKQNDVNCLGHLAMSRPKAFLNLLKMVRTEYQLSDHPNIKAVTIELPSPTGGEKTEKITGILALRPGSSKRPLVIVQCGVFCNGNNTASVRDAIMNYFDSSPFHVLVVANRSGTKFVENNKIFSIGGYIEGWELHKLGSWIRKQPELMAKISSLHLAGISLGGNAALYADQFNEKVDANSSTKVFQSVAAICPVVDLAATLDFHFAKSKAVSSEGERLVAKGIRLIGNTAQGENVVEKVISESFTKEVRKHLELSQKAIPQMGAVPFAPSDLLNYISEQSIIFLSDKSNVANTDAWKRSNNFHELKSEIKTPVFVLAAANDSIVNTNINAGKLMPKDNQNLAVQILPDGDHCAYGAAYGQKFYATILRDFVILNSPELKQSFKIEKLSKEYPLVLPPKLTDSVHAKQWVEIKKDSQKIDVHFALLDQAQGEVTAEIPVADLKKYGIVSPTTEAQAQQITRELNARLTFVFGQGTLFTNVKAKDHDKTGVMIRAGY
jgi:predicted alpha/beta-fold hydrolase